MELIVMNFFFEDLMLYFENSYDLFFMDLV